MDKFWHFFENLNECVYVSDMETYELIYMNHRLREMCGMSDSESYKGMKCYEVLQHCKVPCAMCNNKSLQPGKFNEWWYYNPVFDKNFAVKDSVIESDGRRCRIEISIDMSAPEWKSSKPENFDKLELLANETIRIALNKRNPDDSIDVFLEYIGKALGGERTYIFERNEKGNDDNTYEWVALGVEPMKDTLQDLPAEVCANWYNIFNVENRPIIINDLDDIRENDPLQYENLKRQGIHSLFVVPLFDANKIIGFYGIDNPSGKYIERCSELLQMMAYYIIATIRRRDLIRHLKTEEMERAASIFQQKMTLALAERTQENLDLINEIIGSGLWYMDFDETGRMIKVFWSRSYRRMLGFKDCSDFPDTLEAWSNRLHPEDRDDTLKAYWSSIENKEIYDVKYRLKKKNGEYNWFHSRGRTACHKNGAVRLFIGTFINITEELNAQQALEEAYHAANRANSAKTAFLANMSHDIRTPLNAIIGMNAIAMTTIDDKDKVKHCLEEIKNSSEHLLYLVDKVLDMNRIEAGRMSLNTEPFDLYALIDNFIKMSESLAAYKNHEIITDISGIQHNKVIGDFERIKQCLMNLMSNAIKYTPDNGRIKFSVCEKTTNHPERSCYEFTFEDNGIGMSEDFLPKLFEPFARADDHRAANQQGTGLGMAITRNIIQMMNGNIKAESTLNEGSRFIATIFLELQGASENEPPEKKLHDKPDEALQDYEQTDFSEKRALLVEDNDINAEIAKEILGITGIAIDHAWNGKEAVDILSEAPDGYYDIVLMDIQMPVMDGYEAAQAVRKSGNDIPIIAVSANAFAEDVQRSKASGMNEHIAKPIDFDCLLTILNKYL